MSHLVERLARQAAENYRLSASTNPDVVAGLVRDAIREAVRESATVAWTAVQTGYGADGVHRRILDQIGE